MPAAALPPDESARVARLHALDLLDTGPEAVLDGIAQLAGEACGLPIALISLVDSHRQWFKAAVGLPQGAETPREVSFCAHAILEDGLFEVPDARSDPRFADNPAVVGEPRVVHYAGAPLVLPDGSRIGTLCVAGPQPGQLAERQRRALVDLAAHAVAVLLLREQERVLRVERRLVEDAQLVALSPMGLFSTDARGGVLQANAKCAALLGLADASQLRQGGWLRAVAEEDEARLKAGLLEAVQARQPFNGTFRVRGITHPPRWIKIRVVPVKRSSPVAFMGGAVDVSETKLLEEALEQQNRLLHAILEHLPCGLTVFDAQLGHVLSNRRGREMLALAGEEVEDDGALPRVLDILAEGGGRAADLPAAVADRIRRVASAAPHVRASLAARGKEIDLRAGYLPDGSVVTTYTDLTAERRAAAALATSQDRLSRALEASRLGLWDYDCRSQEIYLSAGWSCLLGRPGLEQQMRAQEFGQFLPAHEVPSIARARGQLLRGEVERISLEHQIRASNGELIWLLSEGQVTERDPQGRALKAVGTSKNITARKNADSILREAMRNAEMANRAKSEFLATMSHEIRTPLNGVIGLTELLSAAKLPPMEADSVAMIDSCAKSLLSVVDNVLDFSKIEAGRLTLDEVPTDVRRMMREVGDVFTVRSAEKGVRFGLSIAPDVPAWVVADPVRLRQILLNLLGNALKFTAVGGFSLSLRLEGGSRPQLAFAVEDSGIGIAPEHQGRLFTRFTQLDASNTRKYSGSGLGLAICRQLAQLMGGDVGLVSQAGAGSTFTLRMPLRVAEAPRRIEPVTVRGQVCADAAILLAEDNLVNQKVAQRMLAMLGYRNVTTVDNGREALGLCSRERFDLVLMDCQMPEMDGWEATRRLRALGEELPILALTASAVAGDRERCLMAGMNDYLTKPIESALLAEKLERWLHESRRFHPPGVPEPAPSPARVPDVFDRSALQTRFFGDLDLFQHCRDLFVQQARPTMDELGSRLREGDALQVNRLAHTMKGSAANLGADRLADYCGRLERGSAGGELPPQAADWLAEAGVALHRFLRESESLTVAAG